MIFRKPTPRGWRCILVGNRSAAVAFSAQNTFKMRKILAFTPRLALAEEICGAPQKQQRSLRIVENFWSEPVLGFEYEAGLVESAILKGTAVQFDLSNLRSSAKLPGRS